MDDRHRAFPLMVVFRALAEQGSPTRRTGAIPNPTYPHGQGTENDPALDMRTGRWAWAGLLGIVLGLLVTELVVGVGSALQTGSIGVDYVFYRDVGAGWLADGTYYRPHQLTGESYQLRINESVVYPPAALLLFVPLDWTPAIAWWVMPLGVLVYVLWGFGLSRWGWLVIALLCLWPRLHSAVLYGNTDMWVAAGVAAGIRWGWPAALIALKPVFLPLALVGVRHWSTWALGAALLVVSLPLLPDYITAMRTVSFAPDYSVGSIVFAVLPLAAWLLRERRERLGAVPDTDVVVATGRPRLRAARVVAQRDAQ